MRGAEPAAIPYWILDLGFKHGPFHINPKQNDHLNLSVKICEYKVWFIWHHDMEFLHKTRFYSVPGLCKTQCSISVQSHVTQGTSFISWFPIMPQIRLKLVYFLAQNRPYFERGSTNFYSLLWSEIVKVEKLSVGDLVKWARYYKLDFVENDWHILS